MNYKQPEKNYLVIEQQPKAPNEEELKQQLNQKIEIQNQKAMENLNFAKAVGKAKLNDISQIERV